MTPEEAEEWLASPPLLVKGPNGDDWFFTGDLAAGKTLAEAEKYVFEYVGEGGRNEYLVHLCDTDDREDPSEWGASHNSLEEAWRYALGAYFGPADEEYSEIHLFQALRKGAWT